MTHESNEETRGLGFSAYFQARGRKREARHPPPLDPQKNFRLAADCFLRHISSRYL